MRRHPHTASEMPRTAYAVAQVLFVTINQPFVETDYTVPWALVIAFSKPIN